MREHHIEINHKKCIGCQMCVHCVAVCPKAAVAITGFDELPVEIDGPVVLDPQQFAEAIRTRRTIRQFKNRPVPAEVIEQIIEAVRFAKRVLPLMKLRHMKVVTTLVLGYPNVRYWRTAPREAAIVHYR